MEQLVTSARVVCHSRPEAANPRVCELVASFLASPGSWTAERAIRRGYSRLALYLIEESTERMECSDVEVSQYVRTRFLPEVAAAGDVALLERLAAFFGCSIDASTVLRAVTSGQLGALQWLVDRVLASLPAGEDMQAFTMKMLPDYVVKAAAREGHLAVLQWISGRVGGLGGASLEEVLVAAAGEGHQHIVEWAWTEMPRPVSTRCVARLLNGGHADMAKFMFATSMLPLTLDVVNAVASYGDADLREWLYETSGGKCAFLAMGRETARQGAKHPSWQWKTTRHATRDALGAVRNARGVYLDKIQLLLDNRARIEARDEFHGLATAFARRLICRLARDPMRQYFDTRTRIVPALVAEGDKNALLVTQLTVPWPQWTRSAPPLAAMMDALQWMVDGWAIGAETERLQEELDEHAARADRIVRCYGCYEGGVSRAETAGSKLWLPNDKE